LRGLASHRPRPQAGELNAYRNAYQRVNQALSRWEEYNCAWAMPPELRPRARRPTLSRPAIKELQGMLCDVIREQEAA
jgi:hypothetical protein